MEVKAGFRDPEKLALTPGSHPSIGVTDTKIM